jgi:hypothetical protein
VPELRQRFLGLAGCYVIQLVTIIDGKRSVMLTGESIEQAEQSCIDRFGADRFEGFEAIPVEIVARSKWKQYRAKELSRADLDEWLKRQEDEQAIRKLFNQMRG